MVVVERLPLDGEFLVLRPPGHAPYMYDLVGVDGVSVRIAKPSLWSTLWRLPVDAFHGWRRSVLTMSHGTVRVAHDGERDRPTVSAARDLLNGFLLRPLRHRGDLTAMLGNHVIIQIDGAYVLLAHLRRGSLIVEPGQSVKAGEVIGEVGNSGNTLAPHLHLQVMSAVDPLQGDIVAWRPRSYERWSGAGWELVEDAPLPLRTPIRSAR